MRALARMFWSLFGVLAVIFMLSPLLLVALFSFGNNSNATLPMNGTTLRWYGALFANDDFWRALANSATITLSVGVVALVVGTLAAFALAGLPRRRATVVLAALSAPLMMPPLVLALALLNSYAGLDIRLGLATVIPGQIVFIQPFVVLVVYARLRTFDHAVIDSARDLGASPWTAFRTVTLPIVAPTLIGATLVAMALSLDEFIITYYTIGGGLTMPTMVWGMLRQSLDPSINALSTIILAFTIGATIIALRVLRYRG